MYANILKKYLVVLLEEMKNSISIWSDGGGSSCWKRFASAHPALGDVLTSNKQSTCVQDKINYKE